VRWISCKYSAAHLAKVHGSPVSELTSEVAKLMPAVAVRCRFGTWKDCAAAEILGKFGMGCLHAACRRRLPLRMLRIRCAACPTSPGARSSSERASSATATTCGFTTPGGLTLLKHAPRTCLVAALSLASTGNRRKVWLSKFRVSMVRLAKADAAIASVLLCSIATAV
jgi:hypothetical protein